MSKIPKFYLFIDDERQPTPHWSNIVNDYIVVICRNYAESIQALDMLAKQNLSMIVDFDHDLGEEKTGYDIAKYIVESGYENIEFRVHSMNIVGRKNITELLTHYGYEELK